MACRFRCGTRVSKRFVKLTPVLAALWLFFGSGVSAYAFVRLANGPHGLYWINASTNPIEFAISSTPAPGISDGSDAAAIRCAFKAWESLGSASMRFQEDTTSMTRSRTDWR